MKERKKEQEREKKKKAMPAIDNAANNDGHIFIDKAAASIAAQLVYRSANPASCSAREFNSRDARGAYKMQLSQPSISYLQGPGRISCAIMIYEDARAARSRGIDL